HRLLDRLLALEPDLRHHRAQALRVLGRRDHRHAEDVRALDQPAARGRHLLERLVGAEALLDVHDHHGGALAGEQAHAAPTTESVRRRYATAPAATVASTRPRRRRPAKQQFSERLSYPASPTSYSASRSTRQKFAPSPTRIAGSGRPTSAAPDESLSTTSSNGSTPGSTSSV